MYIFIFESTVSHPAASCFYRRTHVPGPAVDASERAISLVEHKAAERNHLPSEGTKTTCCIVWCVEMRVTLKAKSIPPSISASPSLNPAACRVVGSVLLLLLSLLCICWCGNSNPISSMGENLETRSNSLAMETSAVVGAAAVPIGWTAVTVADDDGTKSKTVMIRDGADDAEVPVFTRHSPTI